MEKKNLKNFEFISVINRDEYNSKYFKKRKIKKLLYIFFVFFLIHLLFAFHLIIFDKRLELCKDALICSHNALLGTKSDISPIHWQYGAIARLKKGEKIDNLLYGGYSSISLGYIGLYELTKLMTGVPQTEAKGFKFALEVMNYMKAKTLKWRRETNIGFDLYGTPSDSLCHKFAKIDKERFGDIKDITDKGYYTNSYHIDERQKINAFDKLLIESKFQSISNGGSISYIRIDNSIEEIERLIGFVYDNIQYVEFNSKPESDSVYGGENKGKTKEKNLNKVII
jgi:ribonucleoside-triphosphate reductase